MEHLEAKAGEPFYEGSGPPTLLYVGTWDGVAHLLRFGPEDQPQALKQEADRLRRTLRRPKRPPRRFQKP